MKSFDTMAFECAHPRLQFFEGELVALADLVRANESTAHRRYDARLVVGEPMFEVRGRKVRERQVAAIGTDHLLETPDSCLLPHTLSPHCGAFITSARQNSPLWMDDANESPFADPLGDYPRRSA